MVVFAMNTEYTENTNVIGSEISCKRQHVNMQNSSDVNKVKISQGNNRKSKKCHECHICCYKTTNKSNFNKHVKIHSKEKQIKDNQYCCQVCDYQTSEKCHYQKHLLTKIHKDRSTLLKSDSHKEKYIGCPHENCQFFSVRMKQLLSHLENFHQYNIEVDELEFASEGDFESWKTNLQSEFNMKYTKLSTSHGNRQIFVCNRSGTFQSKSKGLRNLKKLGSNKCGKTCPSRILKDKKNNGVYVTFWKTHIGHSNEPERVGLTLSEKNALASSMANGIPKHKVIESIRNSFLGKMTRFSLTSRQDLANIAKKYGLSNSMVQEQNTEESIQNEIIQSFAYPQFTRSSAEAVIQDVFSLAVESEDWKDIVECLTQAKHMILARRQTTDSFSSLVNDTVTENMQ